MANITQKDILAKLKTGFGTISDTGVIITRYRTAQNEQQMFAIVLAQNTSNVCKGWLIALTGIPNQAEGISDCEVETTYRFSLAVFYPYEDKRADGKISDETFRLMIDAVNDWLNADRSLGFTVQGHRDNRVVHEFLQSDDVFTVASWSHGENTMRTHFAPFTLDVKVTKTY